MVSALTPGRAALILLCVAVAQLMVAWGLQVRATASLENARALSETEVESPEGEQDSLDDYRDVLDTLERSIGIREEIDGRLGEVEEIVAALRAGQAAAEKTASSSRAELEAIGSSLGGAAEAARHSFSDLAVLQRRLEASARLARAIAEELEELDRTFGPTVGGPP